MLVEATVTGVVKGMVVGGGSTMGAEVAVLVETVTVLLRTGGV